MQEFICRQSIDKNVTSKIFREINVFDDLIVKSWFDEIFTKNDDTSRTVCACTHKENWKLRKFTLSAKIS